MFIMSSDKHIENNKKELKDAEIIYKDLRHCLEKGNSRLVDLKCEIVKEKKITVMSNEILAVQIYEKTASSTGIKRPGFSFET